MKTSTLAELPSKALVSSTDLCSALGVNSRTLRRMVGAGTLPPPIRIGGSNCWFAGAVLQHWEQMAAEKAAIAMRRAETVKQAMP